MLSEERRKKILELLADEKTMSVERLARSIFVSEPTIRRDLMQLAKEGSIKRTRGGASYVNPDLVDWPFSFRQKENIREKNEIARMVIRCFLIVEAPASVWQGSCWKKRIFLFLPTESITHAFSLKMKPFMLRLPADGTCRKERVFTDKERSTISDAFMRNGASFPLPHSILKRAASITMQRKQRSRGHFMIMRIIPFYSWIIRDRGNLSVSGAVHGTAIRHHLQWTCFTSATEAMRAASCTTYL